jgi:probable rRNA maturation factor
VPTELSIHAEVGRPYVPFLREYLHKALRLHRHSLTDFSIALVGADQMASLHRQFLKIDGPTDVMTFEMDHNPAGRCVSGEVVICVPVARQQARAQGTRMQNELLLYAIHGLLHLTGYDDRDESSFRRMHAREDQLLQAMGIGKVFRSEPVRSGSPAKQGRRKR